MAQRCEQEINHGAGAQGQKTGMRVEQVKRAAGATELLQHFHQLPAVKIFLRHEAINLEQARTVASETRLPSRYHRVAA